MKKIRRIAEPHWGGSKLPKSGGKKKTRAQLREGAHFKTGPGRGTGKKQLIKCRKKDQSKLLARTGRVGEGFQNADRAGGENEKKNSCGGGQGPFTGLEKEGAA